MTKVKAVEAGLLSLDYVKEAAVISREEEASGEKCFVAYMVFASTFPPEIIELREDLKKILPDYMMPSYFIMLKKMPYTPTLKIDRQALPIPQKDRSELMTVYVAPVTELEKKLTKIWGEILRINKVGINDDFFDLGGNSALGIRLVAEVEKSVDIKLPMEAIIRFATVADMAKRITEQKGKEKKDNFSPQMPISSKEYKQMLTIIAGSKISAISPGYLMTGFNLNGYKNPIFWCAVNYEQHPKIAKYLGEDQPLYGIFSGSGIIWPSSMKMKNRRKVMERVAAHYLNEILKVKPDGPYILAGNCNGANLAAEIAFMLINAGKRVEALLLLESFDEILFEYPGKMALIYSKESDFKPYKPFIDWEEQGWEKKFVNSPKIYNIGGDHEEYFNEPYVIELAGLIEKFLNSNL